MDLTCFKAYDIRGRVPDELNEVITAQIARAFVEVVGARRVVIGHDIRLSSQALSAALSDGLRAAAHRVVRSARSDAASDHHPLMCSVVA